MKKIILLCLLSTSVISQTSNIFKPLDVFDLEYVSNTEISPNGNKVGKAFSSKKVSSVQF